MGKISIPAFVVYKLDSWVRLDCLSALDLSNSFVFKFAQRSLHVCKIPQLFNLTGQWQSKLSAKLDGGLFSRGINCCVLRIISLLEVNCLQLGGGGSVSASQNQDWCVSDHPSSGPLVLISLLLGVIGILTKVKLVMDLTSLYLVSNKMLNFELSDWLDKWHKELSFSGELGSWPTL